MAYNDDKEKITIATMLLVYATHPWRVISLDHGCHIESHINTRGKKNLLGIKKKKKASNLKNYRI